MACKQVALVALEVDDGLGCFCYARKCSVLAHTTRVVPYSMKRSASTGRFDASNGTSHRNSGIDYHV
jgi:hypothetical protein